MSGTVGKLVIGGSLVGGPVADAQEAGSIMVRGAIGRLYIGGDLVGEASHRGGSVTATSIGALTLRGSLMGGDGSDSARVAVSDKVGTATIGGSLTGGAGSGSGTLLAGTFDVVSIVGSLVGGTGAGSGSIGVSETLRVVKIAGSLHAGEGARSGSVLSAGSIGAVSIGGNLGGLVAADLKIGSVAVGGDVTGLVAASAYTFTSNPVAGEAIRAVAIRGNFSGAILAGWDSEDGWVNPFGSLGTISIRGNVTTGQISAGIAPGPNQLYADSDDRLAGNGNGSLDSRIRQITIRGSVGDSDAGRYGGFTAERIDRLQVGTRVFPLTAGLDRFDLGPLGNVRLREYDDGSG